MTQNTFDLDAMVSEAQTVLEKSIKNEVTFHRIEVRVVANEMRDAQKARWDVIEKELLNK